MVPCAHAAAFDHHEKPARTTHTATTTDSSTSTSDALCVSNYISAGTLLAPALRQTPAPIFELSQRYT